MIWSHRDDEAAQEALALASAASLIFHFGLAALAQKGWTASTSDDIGNMPHELGGDRKLMSCRETSRVPSSWSFSGDGLPFR